MSLLEHVSPTALKPLPFLYKHRHKILEYWLKLRIKIKLTIHPDILVLGRSGSGKSVLLEHLAEEAASKEWALPNTSNITEFKVTQFGEWHRIIAAAPGQNSAERHESIDLALNKQKNLKGIVYLTDFGFTEIRHEAVKGKLLLEGVDNIESIRQKNLELELEEFYKTLNQLELAITQNRGPKWLIIGFNKIDLYYDQISEARQYYDPQGTGKFHQLFNELYSKIGENNLKVICLPICSIQESYIWKDQEVFSKIGSTMLAKKHFKDFVDQIGLLLDNK